jgi:hypothetical protein
MCTLHMDARMWGQTGRTPLFPNDALPDIFLFQLPNPLLQELPLWFLLGQGPLCLDLGGTKALDK